MNCKDCGKSQNVLSAIWICQQCYTIEQNEIENLKKENKELKNHALLNAIDNMHLDSLKKENEELKKSVEDYRKENYKLREQQTTCRLYHDISGEQLKNENERLQKLNSDLTSQVDYYKDQAEGFKHYADKYEKEVEELRKLIKGFENDVQKEVEELKEELGRFHLVDAYLKHD